MTLDPTSLVVVANPRAAGGRVGAWLDATGAETLERQLPGARVLRTTAPLEATDLVARALAGGARTIVAIGGDGTNHEVLDGFFEGDRPIAPGAALAIVNAGTGGDFARFVEAPPFDRWRPEALLEATGRRIDVGHVAYVDHQGAPADKVFLNITSFGAGGEVVARVNRSSKRLGGFLTFFLASARTTVLFRNRPVAVEIDGQPLEVGPLFLGAIANGSYFGSGMQVAPAARLDDGLFEVVLLEQGRLVRLLMGGSIYKGRHLAWRGTTHRQARTVTVRPLESEPVLLDVDGEQPGRLPATFRILPGVLELLPTSC